jgi:hypothetical protein
VDGPTHFSCNQLGGARHGLGSTLARQQLLAQLGLVPVQLAHWRWDELEGQEARQRLLRELLEGCA